MYSVAVCEYLLALESWKLGLLNGGTYSLGHVFLALSNGARLKSVIARQDSLHVDISFGEIRSHLRALFEERDVVPGRVAAGFPDGKTTANADGVSVRVVNATACRHTEEVEGIITQLELRPVVVSATNKLGGLWHCSGRESE
jgi:hypothetical protein